MKYTVIGDQSPMDCKVEVIDMDGFIVGRQNGSQGQITVTNANFWWPYTMTAEKPGYMYTLKVSALFVNNFSFIYTSNSFNLLN